MTDGAVLGPRVLVTGNAGAGKSTLASILADKLGFELIGLDAVVWQPGWKRTPPEEQFRRIEEIASKPSWVVDGVSSRLWNLADTVIFLDYSRTVSLVRCARRNWRYLFRSRPGLPEHCPEILVIPTLLGIIWRYPTHVRPKLLADFAHAPGGRQLLVIRDNSQLQELLRSIRGRRPVATPDTRC